MTDILDRLNEIGAWVSDKEWHQDPIAAEAQREIRSLRASCAEWKRIADLESNIRQEMQEAVELYQRRRDRAQAALTGSDET